MALEAQNVRELIVEISSPTAKQRELAAEKVADWMSETIDPHFAAILSRALESMISLEESEATLEAQLNAVSEISALGLAPSDAIGRVLSTRTWDQPWSVDYIEGLKEDLPIAP